VPILSISQTTSDSIKISSEQLKITNLIFAEHNKLSKENILLKSQVINLEKIDSIWVHTDSVRREQISEYATIVEKQQKQIKKVKKWSKFKDYVIGGLTILGICLLL
jgi:hypothetical protein